jgi:predicted RNase H-like nuclease (RuvC/YqgF family)
MGVDLYKAFEETANRNIQATVDHSNETRRMVGELKNTMEQLHNMILEQNKTIEGLRTQLSAVQQRVYAGGSSDDND